MKVEELMVGDWVYCEDVETRVVSQDFSDKKIIESFEPISLTPKILKKNGFVIGSYSFCDMGEKFLEYYHHEYRLRLWWAGVDEWENHCFAKDLLGQCNVFYVHELQHALRLFGIDKEIVL